MSLVLSRDCCRCDVVLVTAIGVVVVVPGKVVHSILGPTRKVPIPIGTCSLHWVVHSSFGPIRKVPIPIGTYSP